jgi:hypothetical protein
MGLGGPVKDEIWLFAPNEVGECANYARGARQLPQPSGPQHNSVHAEPLDLSHEGPILEEDEFRLEPPSINVAEERPENVLRSSRTFAPRDSHEQLHRAAAVSRGDRWLSNV